MTPEEVCFNYPEVYDYVLDLMPDGSRFCEVGSWIGASITYLARKCVEQNKHIEITIVDLWLNGFCGVQNPYKECMERIKEFPFIRPLRMASVDAAKTFPDKHFFAANIDADHSYESARDDIVVWKPKIQDGGLLFGHDYSGAFPGVMKAVDELLPGFTRMGNSSWLYPIK